MNIRFDRLATLYVTSPLRRIASAKCKAIPILMYHSISDEDQADLHPYFRTTTSSAEFFAQMEYLHKNKYEVCSPAEAAAALTHSSLLSAKKVVITFDDGYRDFYREAFPILSQFKFTASVFLPTSYIGHSPIKFKGRECLTWSEVRELQRYGIIFGSHTVTHPQLYELDREAVNEEVTISKATIEEKTGQAVEAFCYPYAFPQSASHFKNMLRELLRQAGYRQGLSTMIGRADGLSDPLFMERLPVNGCDDSALFSAKLLGAYDWLAKPQRLTQLLKSVK